jgi:hypothetical protein
MRTSEGRTQFGKLVETDAARYAGCPASALAIHSRFVGASDARIAANASGGSFSLHTGPRPTMEMVMMKCLRSYVNQMASLIKSCDSTLIEREGASTHFD